MKELEHWHPILLSHELAGRPVSTRLAGQELVVFRTRQGAVSALLDRCAHRGMRLSCGKVVNEQLVCPYHGWRYDTDGLAHCPSSPKMTPRAHSFEAVEHQGAIWVRSHGQGAVALPNLMPEGYHFVGSFREHFAVPVEPLLDNFSEVEHVPTTHHFFGYSAENLPELEIEHHATERETYTRFAGPCRQPLLIRALDALNGHWDVEKLVIEASNRFSPLHVELTVWKADAKLALRGPTIKFFYFFVPTSATTTDLVGFVLWQGVGPIARKLHRRMLLSMAWREVLADKLMIERLVETGPSLTGFALTRFDAAVRANRRLLRVIYRGEAPLSHDLMTRQVHRSLPLAE